MNEVHLLQIFANYIEKFEYVNNKEHDESYKWSIAKEFRVLMNRALAADDDSFAAMLYKAKTATKNMIDSYTQPFHGLVEFARREPRTVKQMFLDLYAEDGGNLKVRQEKMDAFFRQSRILLEKYFPESYRYRQNSHSVSAYLFLYDPDRHYMFKATQASIFADCVEFYDDWGSGDHIKLDIFYRMCDQLVEAINRCEELLKTDKSRFDHRFGYQPDTMYLDSQKHMLAFDLIYCCSVYNLFQGISFRRPKTKDRQLYVERRNKAEQLMQQYQAAVRDFNELQTAFDTFAAALPAGTALRHGQFGLGKVLAVDERWIKVFFPDINEEKTLDLPIVLANGLIWTEKAEVSEIREQYASIFRREQLIRSAVSWAENALKPYEEYLD